jgi:uncharacterized protein YoxC
MPIQIKNVLDYTVRFSWCAVAITIIWIALTLRREVKPILANLQTASSQLATSTSQIAATSTTIKDIVKNEQDFYNDPAAIKARREAFLALQQAPKIAENAKNATVLLNAILMNVNDRTLPLVDGTLTESRQTVVRLQLSLNAVDRLLTTLDSESAATLNQLRATLASADIAPLLNELVATNKSFQQLLTTTNDTALTVNYTVADIRNAVGIVEQDVHNLLVWLVRNSATLNATLESVDNVVEEFLKTAQHLNEPTSKKLRLAKFLFTVVVRGALESFITR